MCRQVTVTQLPDRLAIVLTIYPIHIPNTSLSLGALAIATNVHNSTELEYIRAIHKVARFRLVIEAGDYK